MHGDRKRDLKNRGMDEGEKAGQSKLHLVGQSAGTARHFHLSNKIYHPHMHSHSHTLPPTMYAWRGHQMAARAVTKKCKAVEVSVCAPPVQWFMLWLCCGAVTGRHPCCLRGSLHICMYAEAWCMHAGAWGLSSHPGVS